MNYPNDYYVGQTVLILSGPYTSNLTNGMVGEIVRDDPDDPLGRMFQVRILIGSWAGTTVPTHHTQVASLYEAEQDVLNHRAGVARLHRIAYRDDGPS